MKLPSKLLIVALLIFSTAKAQHDHSTHGQGDTPHPHKVAPPHGGEIKDVGKYHFEIVFDALSSNEKLSVWVLKSNLKIIDPEGFTGKVKIKYADGKEMEKILVVVGDKLSCNVEDIMQAFTAEISITINGKVYNAVYNYKGFGK